MKSPSRLLLTFALPLVVATPAVGQQSPIQDLNLQSQAQQYYLDAVGCGVAIADMRLACSSEILISLGQTSANFVFSTSSRQTVTFIAPLHTFTEMPDGSAQWLTTHVALRNPSSTEAFRGSGTCTHIPYQAIRCSLITDDNEVVVGYAQLSRQ